MSKYKPPSFSAGDCLSVPLDDGDFAAGIVMATKEFHCCEAFGCCLVGVLDYKEKLEPSQEIFESRKWLRLTHHRWKGFTMVLWLAPLVNRAMKKQVKVVGKTVLTAADESFQSCKGHGFWGNMFKAVQEQRAWDAALKNTADSSPSPEV